MSIFYNLIPLCFELCSRNVSWGNQEPLTPISPNALKAVATERVSTLATSKKNHQNPDEHM